jgi:hypothetical protein
MSAQKQTTVSAVQEEHKQIKTAIGDVISHIIPSGVISMMTDYACTRPADGKNPTFIPLTRTTVSVRNKATHPLNLHYYHCFHDEKNNMFVVLNNESRLVWLTVHWNSGRQICKR